MTNLGSPLELAVGSSIGIAVTTHPETPAAALIGAADRSMYEAKRGRTGVGPVMVLGGAPVGGQNQRVPDLGGSLGDNLGDDPDLEQTAGIAQDQ